MTHDSCFLHRVTAVGGSLLQGPPARAATVGMEHCPAQGKYLLRPL